jgi:hypothetical protein
VPKTIKIGNAQGFWGDSPDAPARLLAQQPDLDYLTLDYLAEVSLSIMAGQRAKDPALGYARDFIGVVQSLVPIWQGGCKTKIVCNAGGLNPLGCAQAVLAALAAAGITDKKVGLVTGDDVLAVIRSHPDEDSFKNWEDQRPIRAVLDTLVTASAYIGADGVAEALRQGADIVVTGRVADPSLAVGACMHSFGWTAEQYDLLAAGTIAGHIIECGAQACGGISTGWLDLPGNEDVGFPVVEVSEDGGIVVTKPAGTGGRVTEHTVKEQLLYEIGDPKNYLSPDCRVDFTTLQVAQVAEDRVAVTSASGSAPTEFYKVSATHKDGFWASGMLTIVGRDAVKKAQRCGEIVLERLRRAGYEYARTNIECLGAGAAAPGVLPTPELLETVLRVSVADPRKDAVERFTKELAPLVTAGPQGTTGYAAGRPKVHPIFGYWPCLIGRGHVAVEARVL